MKFSAREVLQGLVIGAFLLTGATSFAADEVHVLLSSGAPYYAQVAGEFAEQMNTLQPDTEIKTYTVDETTTLPTFEAVQIVTVGADATAIALANYPRSDILSLLIPMAKWREGRERHAGKGSFAAVVIDQPFERAVLLGRLLKKDARNFGAVFGPGTGGSKGARLERVSDMGIEFVVADVPEADDAIEILGRVIDESEVFIAVPDEAAFNRSIAKWVLHLSFRQKVPVIGFSAAYTKAGALASIYSSPTDVGYHGAELFVELSGDKATEAVADDTRWRAYYPKYYTLNTNKETADLLNIKLPPLEDLRRMYRKVLQQM